jgi:hypothetical protein
MVAQTGIHASYETVRQVLKAGEIVLSPPQHTMSSPDPEYKVKKDGRRGARYAKRGKSVSFCR